jgi:NAD(P)-dependent dehydrogenase (short-subunit alcohol dehydrogenase family)
VLIIDYDSGVYCPCEVTCDGLETTFQVNHLAPFLLTGLLLEALRAAPAARIVNVSSNAHIGARLNFDDLQLEHGYRTFKAWPQ